MKGFLETFMVCLILCAVVTFFGAGLLLSNIWADVVVVALLLAISVTAYMNQDARIDQLEKMVEQLQKEKQPPSEK